MANIALDMFTQCLGGESMRSGVRVVAVHPGPTTSDRHLAHVKERAKRELGDENRWQELHAKMPGGRAATVKEVAETVAFVASDRSSFTSGAAVIIDGGLMAGTLR
jgi:NAD(P)-dependent dehydrogenase (short-subunit alcohol dehydrogenase family)